MLQEEEEETKTEGDSENEEAKKDDNKTLLDPFHYLELIGGCTICGHIDLWGTRCMRCCAAVIGGDQLDYEDEVISWREQWLAQHNGRVPGTWP